MSKIKMRWLCAQCRHPTTITDPHVDSGFNYLSVNNSDLGDIGLEYFVVSCPNPECKKLELTVLISEAIKGGSPYYDWMSGKNKFHKWKLLPESSGIPQPDFIPEAIREDYYESCKIRNLSPKASASLARRCLQGMIRDFWKIKGKKTLKDEIEEIKDKVDSLTWDAIDSVRQIGNIGAHMEKDVNLIIDVDPEEAQKLIGLLEYLFKEWYIMRKERQDSLIELKKIAQSKKDEKSNQKQKNSETP